MSTLEKAWAEIKNAIARSSFRVFPNHLDVEGFPRAYWPPTSKPDEFLALGEALGISLLYVAEETFSEEHVPSAADDDDRSGKLDALATEARRHAGNLTFVAVWWSRMVLFMSGPRRRTGLWTTKNVLKPCFATWRRSGMSHVTVT